jgi:PAS domain S-box-containing protein
MGTIVGRALLRDVYGKPALVLRVDVPRVYFKEAFGELISVLWLAGALSLVMALYVLYLLERHVLSRMERMSREVDRVADRRSLAQRLTVDERGDEISSLTTGINAMLASLQEAQEATAQSEQRRLAVLETMDEGLALVDCATGRILEANGALARMLGHPAAALRGALLGDVLPTAPQPPYSDHAGKSHELLHQRGDGSEIALEALISTLREDTGCLACVLIRDTTERHQVAQEHNRLQEQLQQAQKLQALGQLAAGVAHNFNNVLAVIITAVELALMEAPPAKRRALELALESATKAAGLVRQFVVFSRRQPLQKRPVSLPAVLGEVVEMCRKTFDRRLEVLLEVADEVPLVLGDASQLHGVILNICLNARDALAEIPDKDRPPQVRLRVETLQWPAPGLSGPPEAGADEYVRVTIADNGAGMDDATRERIFEPFFTTKEVGQGTGLGLSTAYAVVSEHGGWIDCRSEPGQGTEMSVYLPVAPVGQLPEGLAERAPLPPAREGACLLVVDDEEALRENLQEMLAREGYHGLVAADGQEGLLLYARHHHVIQAVLLDLSMPRMSGWETLEQILALDPAARVIICTGYPIDPEELHGARTAILKPFNSEDLWRTVREVLEAPE